MRAPTAVDALDSSARLAVGQLQEQTCCYDHVILVSTQAITSRSASFQLVEVGVGGLDAMRPKLCGSTTQFALLRVRERILLVVSLGKDSSGLKRAQVLVQSRALQSSLGSVLFATLTIATASELTSALVGSKLRLEGFARLDSSNVNQDFRASWASTSTATNFTRSKPSAPSSPEEAGLDNDWSRPVSHPDPSHANSDQLPTSVSCTSNLIPSSSLASLPKSACPSGQGMVIDLESVTVTPTAACDALDAAHSTSIPPAERDLPPLPIEKCGAKSVESTLTSSAASHRSASTHSTLVEPVELRSRANSDRLELAQGSKDHRSIYERKRLSNERERLRADEVIRDEVMRKLRAEQQRLLRSPAARHSRSTISPPLAPPPPFAPPLAPPSPRSSCIRSSNPSSVASAHLNSTRKVERISEPASTLTTIVTVPPTPTAAYPNQAEPDAPPKEWLSDLTGIMDSRANSRASMHSLSLWEFADNATHDTFLSSSSLARWTKLAGAHSKTELSATEIATSAQSRSRQASGYESVLSVSPDRNALASSSSGGSIGACSIFDKDLPAPPKETQAEREADRRNEWVEPPESPDSTEHLSVPWREAALIPHRSEQRGVISPVDAELQDLRERLAQAEARARAAENAALVAVHEAESKTRRLAEELAKVERSTKDTMEAEAIRRAKWAREQATRNQLDAYERSKLEADEMRRRRAMEEQRQLECDRANRIREEQEWREHEAERVKHEYELKIQHLAEREAKLKAEARVKEQLGRERKEQAKASERRREKRLAELIAALRKGRESGAEAEPTRLLSGWLNLQAEGAVQWKRRWYTVVDDRLVLSRSATDDSAMTTIPLDPSQLLSVSDVHEDCLVRHALCLKVQTNCCASVDSGLESEALAKHAYIVSTDTLEAKEEIELVIEALRRL